MRVMKRKLAMAIGLFVIGTCQIALADKWQPYQFSGNERFEYKVVLAEDEEKKEATYILDIKKSSKKTKEGEDIFHVTYITKGTLTKEQLGEGAAFGLWGVYGISLAGLVLNPMYGMFFGQMDLEVGNKMSFYGAGVIKVIGKEKVAGKEGFVCQLFQTEDGKEELVAEWTIDPKLAMPLRSKVFERTKVQGQMELIRYTRY